MASVKSILHNTLLLTLLISYKTIFTDLKLFTCGIFLDLKKAFDTVNHSFLLKKNSTVMASGVPLRTGFLHTFLAVKK